MTRTNGPATGELAMIPRWAIILAGALFLSVELFFLYLFARGPDAAGGLPFALLMGTVLGAFLAALVLAAGYVNRDARRRGMNPTLWTLLVLFVPNAIGFILYFLLRPPVLAVCLACGASTRAGAKYCPACGRPLQSGCPACGQAVAPNDAYCPACGRALRGSAPAVP